MFVVESIRVGAETNSSSSHSFIMIPGAERVVDDISNLKMSSYWSMGNLLVKDSKIAGFLISLIHTYTDLDDEKMEFIKKEFGIDKIFTLVTRGDKKFEVDASKVKYVTISPVEAKNTIKPLSKNKKDTFEFLVKLSKKILEDKRIFVLLLNDNISVNPVYIYMLKTKNPVKKDEWMNHPVQVLVDFPYILTKPGNYFNLLVYTEPPVKLRFKDENVKQLKPEYPESIDVKITNRCLNSCPYCHENASKEGAHADIEVFKQLIDQISGRTAEIAIGGGNPLLHPQLIEMVKYATSKCVSVGVTLLDVDFLKNYNMLDETLENTNIPPSYGVSVSSFSKIKEVIDTLNYHFLSVSDVVIHFINRVHSQELVEKTIDYMLQNSSHYVARNIGFLILGYKDVGRGAEYKPPHEDLDVNRLFEKYKDKARLMFDNLAVKQLGIKEKVPEKVWDYFYLGEDGQFTMYIDLVNKEYSVSSYDDRRFKFDKLDVKSMFQKVREIVQQDNKMYVSIPESLL